MQQVQLTPHYSISPTSVSFYKLPDKQSGYNKVNKGWENLKDNNNYYGELSKNATKRLRNKLDYMLFLTNPKILQNNKNKKTKRGKGSKINSKKNDNSGLAYKLTFITLTLPSKQVHTDNEIKSKCLNHFLTELRAKHKVSKYIWKAEKQDNGNIHFHILTDKFIFWKTIREKWNRIVNKLGYVDEYQKKQKEYFKEGFRVSDNKKDKRSVKEQKKAYYVGKSSDWTNPNSTDIHAITKIRNISAYISKYMAKGVTKTKRISKIDKHILDLESQTRLIDKAMSLLPKYKTNSPNYRRVVKFIKKYENRVKMVRKELIKLQKQGVSGRIWSCCSFLSKCKNFSSEGVEECVPDIDIIQKTYKDVYIHEVGKQQIVTVFFDIQKTPSLKMFLIEHIKSLTDEKQQIY